MEPEASQIHIDYISVLAENFALHKQPLWDFKYKQQLLLFFPNTYHPKEMIVTVTKTNNSLYGFLSFVSSTQQQPLRAFIP